MRGCCSGGHGSGHPCVEKNKTSISCNSADGGDRGRDKIQSYSLQNCSNEPWLFSTHWQIVQYAWWATQWKQTVSILFSIADEQSSKASSSVAQHIKVSVQTQKTNNLEHFLLSSHWKLKLRRFQETYFSLLIILTLSIHLSHFPIFLCRFFCGDVQYPVPTSRSAHCLLENSSICPSPVFC